MDIKQQIKKFDEENKPFYMVDHGDGYEWEYVFAKAFEGEENLKKISFDCEAGGFRTKKKHSTGRHRTVHKENKKNKLRSREGTGISACSFIACRDGHKYFLKPC